MHQLKAVLAALALVSVALAGQTSEKSEAVGINPDNGEVVSGEATAVAPVTNKVVSSNEAITIPQMMSYQGRLTDASGVPVKDALYAIRFRLYAELTGGTPLWEEEQQVRTRDGLFSVLLGSVTPIGTVPEAEAAYLGMVVEGSVEMAPRLRIASAAYASPARQAGTSFVPPGGTDVDNAWVRIGTDSVLYTIRRLGIVRGGSNNKLYGIYGYTQTIFGSSCTTGASGANVGNIAIGGGYGNRAWAPFTTVCGGRNNKAGNEATDTSAIVVGGFGNKADAKFAYVAGGQYNTASGVSASVGGGYGNGASGLGTYVGGGENNTASLDHAAVAGGIRNLAGSWNAFVGAGYDDTASGNSAVVCGGGVNSASGDYSTVGGGLFNRASGIYTVIAGGYGNNASASNAVVSGTSNNASGAYAQVGGDYNDATAEDATIGGGYQNNATALAATVAGGRYCDVDADYGFAVGNNSNVSSGHDNSAAFNGQTTTASGQTRVGVLSKASGTFTIDHPLDPSGMILNHYFVESPDMSNVYSGSVALNAAGRGEVRLPDYFSALNRNPRVQLTGVGTSDVFVAEDISGNRFVVGGKPSAKVYWLVTGDRRDPSAEITRLIMPVEQPKTGALAGHSLDDDFLRSTKDQLDRMGVGGQFDFHTAAGRELYEEMKRPAEKHGGAR
jgi:hypothetical protein